MGMFALERWRPFLLFRKFYWGMDNKALTYLNDLSNRMVLDWLGFFQEYDFETRFKRGVQTNDKASSGEAHARLLIQKLY